MTATEIDRRKKRRARRRRIAAAVGVPVLVLALFGGYFYFSGGYDSWRTDRALAEGCDGLLPVDEVRALFPKTALDTDKSRFDGEFCGVRKMHGGLYTMDLNVTVQRTPGKARSVYWEALPLGHGWTGSFYVDDAKDDVAADEHGAETDNDRYEWASVAMLLNCSDAPDDGLFIVVEAKVEGTFRDSATRTRLAAVATETAKRAAGQRNCKAKTGGPVTKVAMPPAGSKGLDQADGTCAGLLDDAEARRFGVSTAREAAAEPAPHEQCVLGDSRHSDRYTLNAFYGPLTGAPAVDLAREGYYTAGAKCPGALGNAVYAIEPDDQTKRAASRPEHQLLRAALGSFAEQSAKRHTCSKPEFS
ncbi:hypothetical protein [Actinomadura alba]|uniref:Uncharacterized protein n=1 Tax=Actinomadura alba TaxID=406431 RepID=A0ABR7LPQ4_9ACTN|nr:hypothetical protein [Actinomadura alba]MBC6466559.1 hypothetical protein [Actinomadura alba]